MEPVNAPFLGVQGQSWMGPLAAWWQLDDH